jgi:hypothetical protein
MNRQGKMRRIGPFWDGVVAVASRTRGHGRLSAWLSAGILACSAFLFTSCAGPQGSLVQLPHFSGAANADLIFRYFSDQVSHVEKPLTMEGPFLVACERPAVLKLAADQPKHDLAVVVLIRYFSALEENKVKVGWAQDLKRVGYQNVVFLLAGHSKSIDGLEILPDPAIPPTVAQH